MKKGCQIGLSIVIVLTLLVSIFAPIGVNNECKAASNVVATILSPNFATEDGLVNQGIQSNQVSTFTPINENSITRMDGNSFKPELLGEDGKKHVDTTFNVDFSVKSIDASGVQLTKTVLEMWINLDVKPNIVTRGLTFELTDDAGDNKIVWAITNEEMRQLTTRTELSEYDKKIFGAVVSNVPVGWFKLRLPIVTGLISGELIKENKFTFTKLHITQTAETGADQPLSFYGISLVNGNENETEVSSFISSYSAIAVDPTAKVSIEDQKYYIGEKFPQFLSRRDVYLCCWIGDINYLDGSHDGQLKVLTDSGIGNNAKEYHSYGSSNFTINNSRYVVAYGLMYEDKFVAIISDTISASDYGKGVWIESELDELEIGKEQKLYFNVHTAFSNATIKFESTDENILEIKEVNTANNYILVKAQKKGSAGIVIKVIDDRLQGTVFEETGIINEDFNLQVVKEEKKVNTTQVVLWIAFGCLCVGLIYLAVKAILDAKKIQIK